MIGELWRRSVKFGAKIVRCPNPAFLKINPADQCLMSALA